MSERRKKCESKDLKAISERQQAIAAAEREVVDAAIGWGGRLVINTAYLLSLHHLRLAVDALLKLKGGE